jgi:uncharacterized protein
MPSHLPDFIDPWRLADRGACLTGRVELRRLPRLRGVVQTTEGEAEYELRFYRDEQGRVRIVGYVRTNLVLECQRCLESLYYPVDTTFNLAVIEVSAEADRLPEECEPVLAEAGGLRLADLLEDELLLAVPQVPKHDVQACKVAIDKAPGHGEEADSVANGVAETSPFAILAKLKSNPDH